MSYILDALRRADAERERDPARGIHAQPAAVLPRDARRSRAPWALAGLVLAAAAAGAYWLADREPERVAAPVERAQPVAVEAQPVVPAVMPVATAVLPPPPMPAPAIQRPTQRPAVAARDPMVVKGPVTVARLAPAPPSPGVTSSPAAVPPPAGAPTAPPPAGAPTAPAAAPPAIPPRAAPMPAPTTAPSTAPTTGPSVVPPATAPAGASTPPARIVAVSELPADLQRELPKLVIAGGVYSENAAQRMLIVAGQVRSEGAELAPGLVLEQIRTNSAVLRYKGWRYSVSF